MLFWCEGNQGPIQVFFERREVLFGGSLEAAFTVSCKDFPRSVRRLLELWQVEFAICIALNEHIFSARRLLAGLEKIVRRMQLLI